ncbi:SAM-dependent methyltransferase [Microbaculum marinisediminis]|uniref:Cyclopropane-fatty-acyl-phospholipid synthase family protein n=1 Tax=Microbaculum marinisediminis TaxID=2931392 RepID=A0AAW5QZG9_9HYPH|nr:cyclopropane-fatty-acyl-phospholipid synthase family protein [Microbaculum sp. A6E488]MCT8973322.1 cyclopropane-fatty-acyl-phospholipid synthase family protein [Microbaculum sp. A6E488]
MSLTILSDEKTRPRGMVARTLDSLAISATRRLVSGVDLRGTLAVTAPDGRRFKLDGDRPGFDAAIDFANLKIIPKGIRRGPIGFAQAYMDGDLTTPDLVAFLRFFLDNQQGFSEAGSGLFRVRLPDRFYHLLRDNTRSGARRNIADHYDLSNAFYRLWLDDGMTYSSAYYEDGANDLASAQQAKYRKIVDALDLEPGHDVLEIGCGWGGFAEVAAGAHDARVTAISLSRAQLAYARERIDKAGLADRCDLRYEDYRDCRGTYDRIASIEMIEAVGEAHWPAYFSTLASRLKASGVAAVQAITIAEPFFERYRRGVDFIQRYIFPGGMLPTPQIIERQARDAGLALDGVETFADSYARTLREWRARFLAAWPQIAALGFDEHFRRKWDYYLAYCEAGFLERRIDVGIYRLVKPA